MEGMTSGVPLQKRLTPFLLRNLFDSSLTVRYRDV